ncbi:flagellar hook-basal body protein [Alkalihalophilus pseudofirmus OF4]|uniref:Flagellar hook-basal body protein n=1 Tax=Alkalihalophilus pseudofirmus (strain ATCC BAA-2126 / JCM 17055 / OF4) TaxID=398511 RepID=D3G0D5_ALKPO|nr:flagellar hook-basal body protein [Alkalihalophilus pseudofirmus]ADC49410.1 flagellar hook-basal body protein [Alkalihalophilus pseudofirmus OF4]
MNLSMISASVTMGQLQRKMDTLSHNMANSNTTGFKRREATFSDLLFQQVNNNTDTRYETGRLTPNGIRVGAGAKIAQTALRMEQGAIQNTDRRLDFAITQPNHFFEVQSVENGQAVNRLTREGAFYLNEDPDNPGQLTIVNANGEYLLDGGGNRFTLPMNFSDIQLSPTGELRVTLNDNVTTEELGQVQLIHVLKPHLLEAVGDTHFTIPNLENLGLMDADMFEQVPGDEGRLMQNALEQSNVNIAQEMNELLQTQRHYQFNARALSMADEMNGLINGIRR